MEEIIVPTKGRVNRVPQYSSEEAAGADLRASLEEDLQLAPGERVAVPTGVWLAIPSGFEGQVRPRSGLALKQGITTLNSPGTIDSDYRGEIKVILINLSNNTVTIKDGDRIAQLVIAPVVRAKFSLQENLATSARGANGFGSTGR